MRRRDFTASLGVMAAGWPLAALGQIAPHGQRQPIIGVLLVGGREPFEGQFRAGLADVGRGSNIQIEFRSAGGQLPRLPALAAELVALNVDLIVASETPAVQAAKQAISTIPIVMAPAGDPLGTGLVTSLARPGGNVTGLSAATAELAGKSLELVRELLPSVRRVAALADPSNSFSKPFLEQIHLSSRTLGIDVVVANVSSTEEFELAFSELSGKRAEAVLVQPTLPRKPPIDLALKYRLPSVSGNRAFADAGGLMSYAGSLADRYRNAALYVDRILKGVAPGDLPVRQPVRFELVINQKTARALDLKIPDTLLALASDVIE